MTTISPTIFDDRIRETATARFNAADVSIVRYRERESAWVTSDAWFGVSIRQQPTAPWLMLGRRHTKTELLDMVEALDPEHIGGRRF
jgi:hypothetical protein